MGQRMAWIQNGVVTNFVIIRTGQVVEFASNSVAIVDPDGYDVQIGDTWDGDRFLRDGEPIKEV